MEEKGGGGVTDILKNDWVMRVIRGPLCDIISCFTFLNVSLCWLDLVDKIFKNNNF